MRPYIAAFFILVLTSVAHGQDKSAAYAVTVPVEASEADNISDTPAIVLKSLVLVKATELGSGFVVHSSPNSAEILTAAHLLARKRAATIYVNGDLTLGHRASILEIDKTSDLALLSIKPGRMVPMILSTSVKKGERIAVIDYPLVALKAAKQRTLSSHDGVVVSVRRDGKGIEYRATTGPAYAGSPLVDAAGYYVGVASRSFKNAEGAYEAVGPSTIHDFLKKSSIDISTMEYTSR